MLSYLLKLILILQAQLGLQFSALISCVLFGPQVFFVAPRHLDLHPLDIFTLLAAGHKLTITLTIWNLGKRMKIKRNAVYFVCVTFSNWQNKDCEEPKYFAADDAILEIIALIRTRRTRTRTRTRTRAPAPIGSFSSSSFFFL